MSAFNSILIDSAHHASLVQFSFNLENPLGDCTNNDEQFAVPC